MCMCACVSCVWCACVCFVYVYVCVLVCRVCVVGGVCVCGCGVCVGGYGVCVWVHVCVDFVLLSVHLILTSTIARDTIKTQSVTSLWPWAGYYIVTSCVTSWYLIWSGDSTDEWALKKDLYVSIHRRKNCSPTQKRYHDVRPVLNQKTRVRDCLTHLCQLLAFVF